METRKISYYKLIKDIILNEAISLKKGTVVQLNFVEGQIYNVEIIDGNEKRIFWVHMSDLEFYKTVNEKWFKKKIEQHNLNINEKWLEYRQAKNKSTGDTKPVETSTNRVVRRNKSRADSTKKNKTGRAAKPGRKVSARNKKVAIPRKKASATKRI